MSNDHTCLPDNIAVGTPYAPINVFIELNMHFAARRAGMILSPSDLLWFYNQVRNKGPWDFKQLGPQYSDFGNFHYGAVGKSMGIPEQVLLRAAGWAQSKAGTTLNSFGQIHLKTSCKYATALISQNEKDTEHEIFDVLDQRCTYRMPSAYVRTCPTFKHNQFVR